MITLIFILSLPDSTKILLCSHGEVEHVIVRGDGDSCDHSREPAGVPGGGEHHRPLAGLAAQGRGREGGLGPSLILPVRILLDEGSRRLLGSGRSPSCPGPPVGRPGPHPGRGGSRHQQRRSEARLHLHRRLSCRAGAGGKGCDLALLDLIEKQVYEWISGHRLNFRKRRRVGDLVLLIFYFCFCLFFLVCCGLCFIIILTEVWRVSRPCGQFRPQTRRLAGHTFSLSWREGRGQGLGRDKLLGERHSGLEGL